MKPLGYIVAIQVESGLRLPFPNVYDTLEEANAERHRLATLERISARYTYPVVVVEVHELGEAAQ